MWETENKETENKPIQSTIRAHSVSIAFFQFDFSFSFKLDMVKERVIIVSHM